MPKQIEGYPNYTITENGEVFKGEHQMSCSSNGNYKQIQLRNENGRDTFKIHRLVALAFIPNPELLPEVDHRNGDKLDNRVENLRWCSRNDNCRNKRHRSDKLYSNFRGVSWIKKGNWERFTASITINGLRKHLGYFKTELDAAKAYNAYIIENNLGDFAVLNSF